MPTFRQRSLFWLSFSAFALAAMGTGYHHLFGTGYFRPMLVTEKKIFDLGSVSADSVTEIEFFVTNGGVRPLRIENVRSGCTGCVDILSFPKGPIRRGASVPVRVALNTESLIGHTRKSFLILSNDPLRSVYPMQIDAHISSVGNTEFSDGDVPAP